MTEPKKADYTKSADRLCNPPEILAKLQELRVANTERENLEVLLRDNENYKMLRETQKSLFNLVEQIKEMIDAQGSYQDLDAGDYALKQRKTSVSYDPAKVKEFIRDYAGVVIELNVNKPKLEGLRKAGLVSQEDLDRCSDTTESFAYIIKAGGNQPKQDSPQAEVQQ